ncbi:MAG: GNAT family N-acetyltransferase [Candidatus Micrarchaeota archaeon]|nr:GNAT family N-acetyltransferase [Candidatus Micrarchaeota archaeon]MDE1847757.1 GNAT family N-acetyltransferase [Candidatus Micrarchaeota archaeon]MDE1863900.1 GNAT family N-acetyltransferase [Candidatus Micrarchaeota archaeon]
MQLDKEISIGRLGKADFSAAAKFFRKTLKIPSYHSGEIKDDIKSYSARNLSKSVKNRNLIFLAAKNDGEIIGLIFSSTYKGTGWIDWVVVEPGYRRRGIAKRLIKEAERIMRNNTTRIWADTATGNYGAVKMLDGLGYRKIAVLGHYYNNDKIIWEKIL